MRLTISFLASFCAHKVSAHFSLIFASSNAFLTFFVRIPCLNGIRNFVRCRSLKLRTERFTPVDGPSIKAYNPQKH